MVTVGAEVGRFCVGDKVETVGDPLVKNESFLFPSKDIQVVWWGSAKKVDGTFRLKLLRRLRAWVPLSLRLWIPCLPTQAPFL